MEKRNTILLTVIAVATLLVAVVGASFAFFAVQETNTANVDVETTTAKASDAFVATSEGALELEVTNAAMQEAESTEGKFISATAKVNVSLTAGSGTATCDYRLTYTPTETSDVYTPTSGITGFEYSLQGSVVDQDGAEVTTVKLAETNMDQIATKLAADDTKYTITDSVDAADTQVAAKHIWTLTAKFYNLPVNQGQTSVTELGQIGKTFAGNIAVTNVSCSNTES